MITYNHAPYIANAIECVLAQEISFPLELVIGEDCSTDGTRDIVFEYAASFPDTIRVVTSDTNVGIRANSWRTFGTLCGKYVALCEGDDFWHRQDKLETQIRFLEQHPGYGLVCSDCDYLNALTGEVQQNHFAARGIVTTHPTMEQILVGKGGILTCTVVARRALVAEIVRDDPYLYRDGPFLMGDTQLWAELSSRSRIYRMTESLATRNLLPESCTRSRDRRRELRFWMSNSEMCLYLCQKHRLPASVSDLHSRLLRRKTLQLAYLERDPEMARNIADRCAGLCAKDYVWYLAARYGVVRLIVAFVLRISRRVGWNIPTA